jgi:hypothetical protein
MADTNDKNIEMMKKILEEKKQKSPKAKDPNGPANPSNCRLGKRKPPKGGIF